MGELSPETRELRLRRRIDRLNGEKTKLKAEVKAGELRLDRAVGQLARWTHCGLCGAPSHGPYCKTHTDLA